MTPVEEAIVNFLKALTELAKNANLAVTHMLKEEGIVPEQADAPARKPKPRRRRTTP